METNVWLHGSTLNSRDFNSFQIIKNKIIVGILIKMRHDKPSFPSFSGHQLTRPTSVRSLQW